jgi:nucleotide-binding universal stress UspA family protein
MSSPEDGAGAVGAEGAALAAQAGFDASALLKSGDPAWQRIVETAEELDAGLIVLGSHG